MKPLVQSVRIDAPAEAVWRTVTDIGRCHEIIPSIRRIEMLGDAPCGLGARWRETRIMFGREATEVLDLFTGLERALASPTGNTRRDRPVRLVRQRP